MNYCYKNEEARFSHDTYQYDKVIDREESVDLFAQLDTESWSIKHSFSN